MKTPTHLHNYSLEYISCKTYIEENIICQFLLYHVSYTPNAIIMLFQTWIQTNILHQTTFLR